MEAKTLTSVGLISDFIGAVVLLFYATKTTGATTSIDQDYLASRKWLFFGWILVAVGFALQLLGNRFQR